MFEKKSHTGHQVLSGFFEERLAFFRESFVSLSNLVLYLLTRPLVITINSLRILYSSFTHLLPHLGSDPYAIFMYSIFRELTPEDRKVSTQRNQKDSSREDEDQVENSI